MMRVTLLALCAALLFSLVAPVSAQNIPLHLTGWKKITGVSTNYSGATDGILNDRQNSYAWSMEIHNGYLYVGTMRNLIGLILLQNNVSPASFPPQIPVPTDMLGRIYRMELSTGAWEEFYQSPTFSTVPFAVGPDVGYRMMKRYKAPGDSPVLYVGGASITGAARLLAIDAQNNLPEAIFEAPGFSIRALAEYNRELFWASEENGYPKIWHSPNPLAEYRNDPNIEFPSIEVPSEWFSEGAEILDVVTYNRALYVFFFDHDFANGGFWCAKLTQNGGEWNWEVVVGDQEFGAIYDPGMGRMENGGATPFIFKNQMYVGTLSNTMWAFLNGANVDLDNIPPTGTQIFRFNKNDDWERVVPFEQADRLGLTDLLNGFAQPTNLYLWRFAEQKGKLYAGTFDALTALELFAPGFGLDISQLKLWDPAGFDLYTTIDGRLWFPETLNGFEDRWNYGARTLFTDPDTGDLYLGTANPFYGCQVWKKKKPRF